LPEQISAFSKAVYFPAIDAGLQSSRNANPDATLSTSAATGTAIYNLHTAQVSASYAPVAFGGVRRGVESLQAQAQQQRFFLEAA
jgi:outer membrane protein TolC